MGIYINGRKVDQIYYEDLPIIAGNNNDTPADVSNTLTVTAAA